MKASSFMASTVPKPPGTQSRSQRGMSKKGVSPAKVSPSASISPPSRLATVTVAPGSRCRNWCGPVKSRCVTPG